MKQAGHPVQFKVGAIMQVSAPRHTVVVSSVTQSKSESNDASMPRSVQTTSDVVDCIGGFYSRFRRHSLVIQPSLLAFEPL